jgi:hypothetical protein
MPITTKCEQAVDVWVRRFNGQFRHEIAAAYVIKVRAVERKDARRQSAGRRSADVPFINC